MIKTPNPMETPRTTEEDILNALIETKCKNTLLIFKLLKRHIEQQTNRATSKLHALQVKYHNLERIYTRIIELKRKETL